MNKLSKIAIIALSGAMCFGMLACTKAENNTNTEATNIATEATVATKNDVAVKDLEAAVANAVGENYFPDTEMESLELIGISADLYDEFIYKAPMISMNCDTLIIVKAKDGKVSEVEQKMNAYRDNNLNDLMQYPSNLTKIQCSQVVTYGNYVVFVQLGGDAGTEAVITAGGADLSEEAAVKVEMEAIEAQNKLATDAIEGLLK